MSSLDRIVGSRSIRPSPRRVGRPPIFDEISLRNTGARTRAPVLPATRAASEAPAAGLTSTTASRAARSNPRRLRAPGVPIQEPTAPGANRGAANRAGPRRYSLNTRLPSASAWFITSCACDRRSVRVRECTRIPDGRNYLELRRSSPAMAGLLSDGGPGYGPHAPRMGGVGASAAPCRSESFGTSTSPGRLRPDSRNACPWQRLPAPAKASSAACAVVHTSPSVVLERIHVACR
jgi:hypothetical protein